MYRLRQLTFLVALVALILFGLWYTPRALNPVPPSKEKRREDKAFVSSSPYWLDRQACRWVGLCGLHHLRRDPPVRRPLFPGIGDDDEVDPHRRLELRSSLPVLGDREREAAWQSAPPPPPPGLASQSKLIEEPDRPEPLLPIPKYVLDYAPLVHLCSAENFWPADIAEHVQHVTPHLDHFFDDDPNPLNLTEHLSLHNMHDLLSNHSSTVYLVSNTDVEHRPEWLYSDIGIPVPSKDEDFDHGDDHGDDDDDETRRLTPPTSWFDVDRDRPLNRIADPRRPNRRPNSRLKNGPRRRSQEEPPPMRHHKPDGNGYSKAPAVLILVDKGSGIVDAFWFFFYSYNLGQTVLGIRFGNHVGDWEHAMVRFENGVPRGIFFSEHEGGQAYAWEAVEKRGGRPVIYSAVGSHAMYALPGIQAYILPFKLLKDVTDRGPIWDPAKNIYAYHYDYALDEDTEADGADSGPGNGKMRRSLRPAEENPGAPTGWFHYAGAWGDKLYGLADPRQWRLFGQYHYVTGPSGPKFKNLDRQTLCQTRKCRVLHTLVPGTTWY